MSKILHLKIPYSMKLMYVFCLFILSCTTVSAKQHPDSLSAYVAVQNYLLKGVVEVYITQGGVALGYIKLRDSMEFFVPVDAEKGVVTIEYKISVVGKCNVLSETFMDTIYKHSFLKNKNNIIHKKMVTTEVFSLSFHSNGSGLGLEHDDTLPYPERQRDLLLAVGRYKKSDGTYGFHDYHHERFALVNTSIQYIEFTLRSNDCQELIYGRMGNYSCVRSKKKICHTVFYRIIEVNSLSTTEVNEANNDTVKRYNIGETEDKNVTEIPKQKWCPNVINSSFSYKRAFTAQYIKNVHRVIYVGADYQKV